jgi:hypothetical protein
MFRRSLVLSLIALATLMSGSQVDLAHAQSMPAGQVSRRLAHTTAAVSTGLANFKPSPKGANAQPPQQPANMPSLSSQPGIEVTNPALVAPTESSSANPPPASGTSSLTSTIQDDENHQASAKGTGEITLWNEVVCLDKLDSFHVTGLTANVQASNTRDPIMTIAPCVDSDSTTPPSPHTPDDTHAVAAFSSAVATDMRNLAKAIPDSEDLASFNGDLQSTIQKEADDAKQNPDSKSEDDTVIAILRGLGDSVKKIRCFRSVASVTTPGSAGTGGSTSNSKTQYDYDFRNGWAPLDGNSCDSDAVESFFAVSGPAVAASNAQYLYNAELSTSQLTAQLLTGTLGNKWKRMLPLQLVLSGTATNSSGTANTNSSSSQNSSGSSSFRKKASSSAATDPAAGDSTDPAATAAAQLQAGGDFNISAPMPLFNYSNSGFAAQVLFSPNLGFNINGFSGQSTITQATEYAGNLPFELYAQTRSNESDSSGVASAVFFLDLKPSIELLSSALSQSIGPGSSGRSFLGQAALGVEFSQRIRISGQYIYGSKNVFNSNASSGSSATSTVGHNGFHFAVSFSPGKSKSGN